MRFGMGRSIRSASEAQIPFRNVFSHVDRSKHFERQSAFRHGKRISRWGPGILDGFCISKWVCISEWVLHFEMGLHFGMGFARISGDFLGDLESEPLPPNAWHVERKQARLVQIPGTLG